MVVRAENQNREFQDSPVNKRSQNLSLEKIKDDVEYSFSVANSYYDPLIKLKKNLNGLEILEVGPGINLGTAYLLRSWGAKKVVAIDKYVHEWSEYQSIFFEYLVQKNDRDSRNKRIVSADKPTGFEWLEQNDIYYRNRSLEELNEKNVYDAVVSNATIEHLSHTQSAFNNLFGATKAGGIGVHQIDFRDHRDFSRPLEYLLLDELEFAQIFLNSHGECGNRYRPHEIQELFKLSGFSTVEIQPNMNVDEIYWSDFRARIEDHPGCRASYYSARELKNISAKLILIK